MVDSVIFWAFALLSIGAALGAILNRSIIYSALCLIAVFFSIAGFFLLNNADFLAISQIIIYAVGLTIIMLFAIMFTGDKPFGAHRTSSVMRLSNRLVVLYVFALLMCVVGKVALTASTPASPQLVETLTRYGSTTLLGTALFSQYALPFEVASILLLAAMIGAIVIAKKRFVESDVELLGEMRLPLDVTSSPTEAAIRALRAERLGESEKTTEAETSSKTDDSDKTLGVK